ncbi:hypothetical protein J2X16_001054 [Pelomonas aquatica]|uniref:Polysaccharide biosynthesis protein n=1 Tax=Pelomonas aquatica TaxID=431058 RepID=A0ABU1Z5L2_9BURK|nr:hypothetical protein [Pelomonas aquatica]MDR7295733.1 hypothetical protein [Pelomonas aquatica]
MKALFARLWNSPTFTTWGSLAVRLGGVVLVLPWVLATYAPPEVAVWQLLSSVFVLALLFDFGLAPTFTRMLSFARGGASLAAIQAMRRSAHGQAQVTVQSQSAPDRDAADTLASVYALLRWLYPRLGFGVVAMLGVAGSFAIAGPIAATAAPGQAWLAWGLVLATTWAGFVGNAYAVALQGMNNIAVLRRWEAAAGLAQIGSTLAVLAFNGSLLALVASYQVWIVLNALRNVALMRALHPQLSHVRGQRDPVLLRALWPATWRSGLGVVMGQGIIQSSGWAYAQVAPVAEVASYLLALRLITMVSQFAQAPFYSKLPRLAELQAKGERGEQLALARHGMRMAHWVFVAGAITLAVVAVPLLGLLHSKTAFVPASVWALMCTAFFVERFGAMHLQLYSLSNHIVWHIANGVTGCLMLALALLLYPWLGMLAFALAMLLAYAGFYAVYSIVHSRRAFQFNLWTFERGISLPPAFTLLAALGLARLVPALKAFP